VNLRTVYGWLSADTPPKQGTRWRLSREYIARHMGLPVDAGAAPEDLAARFFATCRSPGKTGKGRRHVLDDWRIREDPALFSDVMRELAALVSRKFGSVPGLYLVPGNTRPWGDYTCPAIQVLTRFRSILPVQVPRKELRPVPDWESSGDRPELVYLDCCYSSGDSIVETHQRIGAWVRQVRQEADAADPTWEYPRVRAVAVFYCNHPTLESIDLRWDQTDPRSEKVPILRVVTCPDEESVCEMGSWQTGSISPPSDAGGQSDRVSGPA
jgi:hypothetical protein